MKKMLRHAEALAVKEYANSDNAIWEQRNVLTEELYRNTFQLYKSADHWTLDKVLEVQPKKLELIVEMKQIHTIMAQKEAMIKNSLVHKVFLGFFFLSYACTKLRSGITEAIHEVVIYLVHTRWHLSGHAPPVAWHTQRQKSCWERNEDLLKRWLMASTLIWFYWQSLIVLMILSFWSR